jgi:hypothetical protein
MPTPKLSRQLAEQAVQAIELALEQGYQPQGYNSATEAAARSLNMDTGTLNKRVKRAKEIYGLEPDWTKATPIEEIDVSKMAVEQGRKDRMMTLERERTALARQLAQAEALRQHVFGLAEPLEPLSFDLPPNRHAEAETIVVMLSDIQYGEVVDLMAMDGVNSYNLEIANGRIERFFASAVALATRHWSGPPPARLILILGGDMVSGDIHDELIRTNELAALPAVRQLARHIIAGIQLLLKQLPCAIDVISVPGNHGRTTMKPQSKQYTEHSYDTLLADMVEMHFSAAGKPKRLNFFVPSSGDAVFSIYGWQWLVTHGDRIGSRGGQGFVGPAATVARGFKKLQMDYGARGIHIDVMMCGHFHTAMALEEGYCNGTLVGPSEYSRNWRYRPRPATQWFLSVHPARGVTQKRMIQVGDAAEGSIYAAPETPAKPRFRVPVKAA